MKKINLSNCYIFKIGVNEQNDSGKIIAPDPKKWFGSAMTHLDTSDIVPDRWIIKEWDK